MDCNLPGFPALHHRPELAQTHVHWIGDAIQSSHSLPSPSPSAFNLPKHQNLFQWVSSSYQVAQNWSFSFSISPSNEYSGLISLKMDWLDLLAVQGIPKSLLQHHSSKASILQCSSFCIVQLSRPYVTTGKTIALTRWTFVGRVMSLQMALFDSLLWLSNSPSCMFPTSSYYSSVDGHLGCFHLLVIINSPVMNVGVHVSFWIKASVPSRYKPSNGVAGSCVNSIFSF